MINLTKREIGQTDELRSFPSVENPQTVCLPAIQRAERLACSPRPLICYLSCFDSFIHEGMSILQQST